MQRSYRLEKAEIELQKSIQLGHQEKRHEHQVDQFVRLITTDVK